MVQWLRLHAANAGSPGFNPRQATGSHMPQLKISNAATETQSSQINIKKENLSLNQNAILKELIF